MKLIELNKIFDIQYGNQFDSYKLDTDENSDINFVTRSNQNLGVGRKVSQYNDIEPFPEGLITVALGGSVLSTFIQLGKFYTGQNIKILTPKYDMNFNEKVYYCLAIERNKFRYSACGREANITLHALLIPDKVPKEFLNIEINTINISKESLIKNSHTLQPDKWKSFEYDSLFKIKKGKRLTKEYFISGKTPFIGSIDSNNGYRDLIGQEPIHEGNTITVNYNGSVGEAFYQPVPFWASDDVNVLYPKYKFNKYLAMFILPLIRIEKYRFNYGRKWEMERMKKSTIKLPVDKSGNPDWQYMENYIKSLPYSSSL
jgi:hypothetical protein